MSVNQIIELKLHPKIFVSPFRRTIQTACLMLENHPLKDKVTLFLDPIFKEKMSNQNTMMVTARALQKYCQEMS